MASSDRILANVTSLDVADSLENLSLDSQTKKSKVVEPVKKDAYGDNGSYMYPQTYGYVPYGPYSVPSTPHPSVGHDLRLPVMQEYHYPSHYYQPPLQSWEPQMEFSNSGVADQSSLSIETNKGNSNTMAVAGSLSGNGSGSLKSTFKNSTLNPNASYKRGGLPTGNQTQAYQDPRFSYDFSWFDMSMSSNGESKNGPNSGFSSYTNNLSSGRNQNLHLFPHVMNLPNARPSPGVGQAYGYMNHMYPNNMSYGHYGNTIRGGSAYGSYGYDSRKKVPGWYTVGNNNKSRGRGYGKQNMDGLSELNKGPRVKGSENHDGFGSAILASKDQNLPLTETKEENTISIAPDMEQYNKEDFPESYSDARFFVIKSYSEDDVHKSIKYNVWASTLNGNKKLDAAFKEAKEKRNGWPVFLFFSVNTSGQFVGLAEMLGPVDFERTVEYWQQDKWTGCFPVKWHIIKDVPNSSLRHITLENNENKPVTNSRDTQEVNFEQGIQILKIFKNYSSQTCILDDFEFYESRQKIIQEKKAKHQLLQKQVWNGEPNSVVADDKQNATIAKEEPPVMCAAVEVVMSKGDVKPVEENGSVAATEDSPTNSAC